MNISSARNEPSLLQEKENLDLLIKSLGNSYLAAPTVFFSPFLLPFILSDLIPRYILLRGIPLKHICFKQFFILYLCIYFFSEACPFACYFIFSQKEQVRTPRWINCIFSRFQYLFLYRTWESILFKTWR